MLPASLNLAMSPLPAPRGCSGARLLHPSSGEWGKVRNAELEAGRGREDLPAASTVVLYGKVTSFSCAQANSLLSAGEKPQLHDREKKDHLPAFHCKQEEY